VYGIGLPHGRDQWRDLVNDVMNLRVLYNAVKFLSGGTKLLFAGGGGLCRLNWLTLYLLNTAIGYHRRAAVVTITSSGKTISTSHTAIVAGLLTPVSVAYTEHGSQRIDVGC
jgi:hypothetical protein